MSKKQKILHFHPNGFMASKFVLPLIRFERQSNFHSQLITSDIRFNKRTIQIPYNLTIRNFPLFPLAIFKLCRLILRYKPSIVLCHNSRSAFLPLLVAKFFSVPTYIYFNHGVPFSGYKGLIRFLFMLIEYVNCSLAKKILTVSNGMRALLTSIKPSADIGIIGSGSAAGIDLQAFNRDLYKYSLFFEGLGISQEDFVTVFIGRPEIRKGFGLVIELWKNQFKNNSTKLLLCGPEDADVANILGDVPENIICLGFVENIAEILSLSDCLILPSLHEGLSYAVLEAMACKCLVIANNIPGMQYLITDGESGFLVDDNDAVGYAKILDLIRNNHFDINSIKEKGYISIQKFSRESFMKSYIKFLRKQGLDSN